MDYLRYWASSNPRTDFEPSIDLFIELLSLPETLWNNHLLVYIHEPVNTSSINNYHLQ